VWLGLGLGFILKAFAAARRERELHTAIALSTARCTLAPLCASQRRKIGSARRQFFSGGAVLSDGRSKSGGERVVGCQRHLRIVSVNLVSCLGLWCRRQRDSLMVPTLFFQLLLGQRCVRGPPRDSLTVQIILSPRCYRGATLRRWPRGRLEGAGRTRSAGENGLTGGHGPFTT
jgi:hypothetical protein